MKASILDLRRQMSEVLKSLDHNEPVTILHRGKEKAVLYPAKSAPSEPGAVTDHPAFGMWKNRKDISDVGQYVRRLRKGRHDAI
ncbi:MAG: type II toxin-antitoxin system prevent-host-death family antitoxin [Thermoguttaceae bacterium]|jgi:prevent-host-death family protein